MPGIMRVEEPYKGVSKVRKPKVKRIERVAVGFADRTKGYVAEVTIAATITRTPIRFSMDLDAYCGPGMVGVTHLALLVTLACQCTDYGLPPLNGVLVEIGGASPAQYRMTRAGGWRLAKEGETVCE